MLVRNLTRAIWSYLTLVECYYSEGGPLPDEIVKLLDEAWEKAMPQVPWYAET